MIRSYRALSTLLLALSASACCTIAGDENATTKVGAFVPIAFGDGGSDLGLGAGITCDCTQYDNLQFALLAHLMFPDIGNWQALQIRGNYVLSGLDGPFAPYFSAGLFAKRFAYGDNFNSPGLSEFGGGGSSSDSEFNFGVSAGVGVSYTAAENVTPFAELERWQGDGGFQMFRAGVRFDVGGGS